MMGEPSDSVCLSLEGWLAGPWGFRNGLDPDVIVPVACSARDTGRPVNERGDIFQLILPSSMEFVLRPW